MHKKLISTPTSSMIGILILEALIPDFSLSHIFKLKITN